MKIVNSLFKEDRLGKELKSTGLLTNTLQKNFLKSSIKYYEQMVDTGREQQLIKYLLKCFEEKGMIYKKIKILTFWTQIFKLTKYDLSDILLNKKLKIFTKSASFKHPFKPAIDSSNVEDYCLVNILVPIYNYFMKLAANQDLFRHCVIGKVPENQAFRRGTKIRYIWVFKIYNIINIIISIMHPCCTVLKKFPNFRGLFEITKLLYNDLLTMNNFVIQAIEQGSQDNFLLMPYFDLLQFYESLTQQSQVGQKIDQIYISLQGIMIEKTYTQESMETHEERVEQKEIQQNKKKENSEIKQPRVMHIDKQTLQQIQTQALKVQLISCSLKNPKKKYTHLETQYYEKLHTQENKIAKTEQNEKVQRFGYSNKIQEDFIQKYKNLD